MPDKKQFAKTLQFWLQFKTDSLDVEWTQTVMGKYYYSGNSNVCVAMSANPTTVHASVSHSGTPAVDHGNTAAMRRSLNAHWSFGMRALTICFGGLLGAGMASLHGSPLVEDWGSEKGKPAGGHVSRGPTP